MAELSFSCLAAEPKPYAVSPTLLFRLHVEEASGAAIHAIALRCQMRIEPQRRQYGEQESDLLRNLFGERERWGDTLKPLHFCTVSAMVPSFTASTEFDLPVECTYDLDIAASSYFHSLDAGVIPLTLMFSGTVFGKGERGFWVDQVPWHLESSYMMPVLTWQRLMDTHFPNQGWLRLHRDSVNALLKYKTEHAIASWDTVIEKLLGSAAGGRP